VKTQAMIEDYFLLILSQFVSNASDVDEHGRNAKVMWYYILSACQLWCSNIFVIVIIIITI